jgi:signal transduction histidine kinase
LRESVGMLRARIPATMHIVTAIADVPPVLGDSGQLHQIVLNLATNAAQVGGGIDEIPARAQFAQRVPHSLMFSHRDLWRLSDAGRQSPRYRSPTAGIRTRHVSRSD